MEGCAGLTVDVLMGDAAHTQVVIKDLLVIA